MDMELYVTKHRMLQDFLAKIGELLKKPVDKRAAEAISDEINKMTGVLNMRFCLSRAFAARRRKNPYDDRAVHG